MAYIQESVITSTVRIILNTRDFCGNEAEAAKEHLREEGVTLASDIEKAYTIAHFRANAQWNNYKKEAGVKAKYRF